MEDQRQKTTGKRIWSWCWFIFPVVLMLMRTDALRQADLSGTSGKTPVQGSLEIVPADLTVSKEEQGDRLHIQAGSLELSSIPPGWKMEERISEEGVKQYVLMDVHSQYESEEIKGHRDGYEHEIVITPYKVSVK